MPYSIRVERTNRRFTAATVREIQRAVREVLQGEKHADARIDVLLMDDKAIGELHARYFDDPDPTDVITFPLSDEGELLEGEIAVSYETAVRSALDHGVSIREEVLLYVIHGVLHLCGLQDSTAAERRRMRRAEKKYLHLFTLDRDSSTREC